MQNMLRVWLNIFRNIIGSDVIFPTSVHEAYHRYLLFPHRTNKTSTARYFARISVMHLWFEEQNRNHFSGIIKCFLVASLGIKQSNNVYFYSNKKHCNKHEWQLLTFVFVYRWIQKMPSGSGSRKSLFQVSMILAGTMAGSLLHQRVISAPGRPS